MRHLLWAALLIGAFPAVAPAGPGDGAPDATSAPAPAVQLVQQDFFFGRPRHAIVVRGSFSVARADSDWFDFVTEHLTLNHSDFNAGGIGFEVVRSLAPRLDVIVTADLHNAGKASEFRAFVENGSPISQRTELRQVAYTVGARYALTAPGRAVSSLAWIPARITPYVGGGGGVMYYRVRQNGDFVNIDNLAIFTDLLESDGWTPAVFVNAGADVHVYRRAFLNVDGRYLWASPQLGEPWRAFEELDLAGFRLSGGISIRF